MADSPAASCAGSPSKDRRSAHPLGRDPPAKAPGQGPPADAGRGDAAPLFGEPGRALLHRRRRAQLRAISRRTKTARTRPSKRRVDAFDQSLFRPHHARHPRLLPQAEEERNAARTRQRAAGTCGTDYLHALRRSGRANTTSTASTTISAASRADAVARHARRQDAEGPAPPRHRLSLGATGGLGGRPARVPRQSAAEVQAHAQGHRRPLRQLGRSTNTRSPIAPISRACIRFNSGSRPTSRTMKARRVRRSPTASVIERQEVLCLAVQDPQHEEAGCPHPRAARAGCVPADPSRLAQAGLSVRVPRPLARDRDRKLRRPSGSARPSHGHHHERRRRASDGQDREAHFRRRHAV